MAYLCETCIHYPPSSTDGKPCSQCDPGSKYNNCYQERPCNAVGTILNNHVNLCDSCKHLYPECDASTADIAFGDGKGNDNVCMCSKYIPVAVNNILADR